MQYNIEQDNQAHGALIVAQGCANSCPINKNDKKNVTIRKKPLSIFRAVFAMRCG